jgi:hypothetical protein
MGFYDLLAEYKSVDALGKCKQKDWLNQTRGRKLGASFAFTPGPGGVEGPAGIEESNGRGLLPVPIEDTRLYGDIRRGEAGHYYDGSVELFRSYKFVLSFENTPETPGYFTEKLVNPVLAGSIPIYWGAPDIGRHVNTERIILCDFATPHGKRVLYEATTQYYTCGNKTQNGRPVTCRYTRYTGLSHLSIHGYTG